MTADALMIQARRMGASDIHISEGLPLMFRVDGALMPVPGLVEGEETAPLIAQLVPTKMQESFRAGHDLDFAYALEDGRRQRVNVFYQNGKTAATIRLLNDRIPTLESLQLPSVLKKLAREPRGLILVTGPTGSGKSTTLAAMIDEINTLRAEHIITIEDPVEYVFAQKKCLVHQREVGRDVATFAGALRSALREDPDIILVGEMRDYETVSAALTAAETGHLVLSTLHTTGAPQTVDRIIDACPTGAQNQVRTQLSGVLRGVISQCLVPCVAGGRIAATEVLVGSDAALSMIRENKCHQLGSVMQSSAQEGMHTLNADLAMRVRQGQITMENAMKYASDKRELNDFLS